MGESYGGLLGGASVLQPEVDGSLTSTQYRTTLWTRGTVAMSPTVAQLATVVETSSQVNIAMIA